MIEKTIQDLLSDVTKTIEETYGAYLEYVGYDDLSKIHFCCIDIQPFSFLIIFLPLLERIVTASYWTDVFSTFQEDFKRHESRIHTELDSSLLLEKGGKEKEEEAVEEK
jgi:hypothetical protein